MRVARKALQLTAAIALGLGLCGAAAAAPPAAPDADSEGRLLVLNANDDTLDVFDVPSNRRLATVPVGDEPHEVVATPDGRKAYVANLRGGSLTVVDLTTLKVARTLKPAGMSGPHGLAMASDGRAVLVTSEGSRRLFMIDAARDAVLRAVTTSQDRAHMVAAVARGRRAYVANVGSGSVTILHLPEMRILRHLKVGGEPEGIAVTPNGRWVLVALQKTDQVAILDAESGQRLGLLPAGRRPIRIAVTPDSFTALVSNRDSDDVTVLDVLGRRVKRTVRVGRRPGGIVTNARGTRAYVCNNEANTVAIVSVPGFEVSGTIATGGHPDGIAFVAARPRVEPPKKAVRARGDGTR